MSTATCDVAIVGYGPVGAFTALLLAEEGLRVAIVERSRETLELPRAVGLDGESVRAFQRIGRGDEVAALLQPAREHDEVCFTNSKRERLFGAPIPPTGANGWRDVSFFDQPELEALLRGFVGAHDRIDVHLGETVHDVTQTAEGVWLRCESGLALEARYAVGCDGASSFVREALGIEWTSLGYDQDWLVVDVLQTDEADLPLVTMQVCDPERLTTYVCVKDPNRRWEFQLRPGETREQMLRPETIERLLAPWLPPEHYAIRRAAVYQFHAATAERWREGRVFLAGDAAHQTPPFLGQGLNAGFRDAVNLAWKLARVVRGESRAALLDSYADERDAHARDLVDWAVAIGKLMETLAAREAGRPDPHAADERSGYGQGRTAPPLRGGVLAEGQEQVGVLLHQPTVCGHGEAPARLDELLGRDFAIVGRSERDLALGEGARRILERVGGRSLALEGLDPVDGRHDPLFERHPAVVVRPDRYVFGVVEPGRDLDALIGELGDRLQLEPADRPHPG